MEATTDTRGRVAWVIACLGVLAATIALGRAVPALAAGCPKEPFRTGRSASLPDCRAYELVTPEELGRAQAIAFEGVDQIVVSADGEHVALSTLAPFGPSPSEEGTRVVFSRSAEGWRMVSAVPPGGGALGIEMDVLDPEMSTVGLETVEPYDKSRAFEVGPVGGPYTRIMSEPAGSQVDSFAALEGANEGTPTVAPFHSVLFNSSDHQLLPPGRERELAEEVPEGEQVLYEWSEGRLRLVNVEGEGANLRLLPGSECGAALGGSGGKGVEPGNAIGAVSGDGSRVLFETSIPSIGCSELGLPSRLWLRVDGRETVEVSAPAPGVTLGPGERSRVSFNEAVVDVSEVFFETSTPLTAGETPAEKTEAKLFMYDTRTRVLSLIALGVTEHPGTQLDANPLGVLASEDGSTVYYTGNGSEGRGIYRYDVATGDRRLVAKSLANGGGAENQAPSYTTPDGRFLVFSSAAVEVAGPHGLELEPRGASLVTEPHSQLYRYDAASGSVICVSCGSGVAPIGELVNERGLVGGGTQRAHAMVQISEDGGHVFFETTAQLVPQDTNTPDGGASLAYHEPGIDVYEWEGDGVEEAPGVFCRAVVGCTHLISAGEAVGPEHFLGASRDGRDLFFDSAAQLVPWATPEFPNIYDARVDGGFPRPAAVVECTSCQGVGAPAPLFGAGASATFAGAGDPPLPSATQPGVSGKAKRKSRCRRGFRRNGRGRCVRVARNSKRGHVK